MNEFNDFLKINDLKPYSTIINDYGHCIDQVYSNISSDYEICCTEANKSFFGKTTVHHKPILITISPKDGNVIEPMDVDSNESASTSIINNTIGSCRHHHR